MSARRTPPKARHRDRITIRRPVGEPVQQHEDTNGYSAPSHMGGQFDPHEHGSGHGPIGFTQHLLP